MVQLFVKKEEEPRGQKQPERADEVAEKVQSREEMEKKKAAEVMQSVTTGQGSTWVTDAEQKLRGAQESYETEKLRQDLLGEVSSMNTDQISALNGRISSF